MPALAPGALWSDFADAVVTGSAATDPLTDRLLIDQDRNVSVYYAPMDGLRRGARLAIVGITPGRETARIAHETMRVRLAAGDEVPAAMDAVKATATFSGFRPLLIDWLDWLGVADAFSLPTSADLWTTSSHLVHPTSAVRYPVIVGGRNYTGSSPKLIRHPMLSQYLETTLAPELALLPDALVLPLGRRVDEGLNALCANGLLDQDRCLVGFPHPSGANGSKWGQWEANRELLRAKAAAWFAAH